ncbi:hypothetical protein SAMN02910317_01282 [Ruminococcaceae bacterium FB2012]|nr:hypothetical protein SAMN02910317_01282 [Ruminococcaceae bacterium FB2012]
MKNNTTNDNNLDLMNQLNFDADDQISFEDFLVPQTGMDYVKRMLIKHRCYYPEKQTTMIVFNYSDDDKTITVLGNFIDSVYKTAKNKNDLKAGSRAETEDFLNSNPSRIIEHYCISLQRLSLFFGKSEILTIPEKKHFLAKALIAYYFTDPESEYFD